jgi:hypothetical protein
MRQYYSSDKKKREEAKRKRQEQKRLKRQNKRSKNSPRAETTPAPNAAGADPDVPQGSV